MACENVTKRFFNLARFTLERRAWCSPFTLDIDDQVWPENFGGLYKAPAVDLVSGVYMVVQEDAE